MEKITITVDSYKDVSDGYHTIGELYDHRIMLYISLCKILVDNYHSSDFANDPDVWRSKLHSDGSSYDGWFILGIGMEKGEQITYHIPIEKWNECEFAKTLENAPEWDGHTSADVLERLKNL